MSRINDDACLDQKRTRAVLSGRVDFACKVKGYASRRIGWLVGWFEFNDPWRQYFNLYRAVSQKEGERRDK